MKSRITCFGATTRLQVALVSAAVLLLCGNETSLAFEFESRIPVLEDGEIPMLGSAYDLDKLDSTRDSCVVWDTPAKNSLRHVGACRLDTDARDGQVNGHRCVAWSKSDSEFSHHQTKRSASDELSAGYGARAETSWAVFDAAARASQKRESASQTTERSVYVSGEAWGISRYWEQNGTPSLSEQARSALLKGDDSFRKLCGDGYVSRIFIGGRYTGLFTLKAKDLSQSRAIQTELGVDLSTPSTDASFELDLLTMAKLEENEVNISAQGQVFGIPDMKATTSQDQIIDNLDQATLKITERNYGALNPVAVLVSSYDRLIANIPTAESQENYSVMIEFRNGIARAVFRAREAQRSALALQRTHSHRWLGMAKARMVSSALDYPLDKLIGMGADCSPSAPESCVFQPFSFDDGDARLTLSTLDDAADWSNELRDDVIGSLREMKCMFESESGVLDELECNKVVTQLRVTTETGSHGNQKSDGQVDLAINGKQWTLDSDGDRDDRENGQTDLYRSDPRFWKSSASVEDLASAEVTVLMPRGANGAVDGWCANKIEMTFQVQGSSNWYKIKRLPVPSGQCLWFDDEKKYGGGLTSRELVDWMPDAA